MITQESCDWPADLGQARTIRDAVHRWLSTLPLSAGEAASVVVAVDAAVENAIRHAYQAGQDGVVTLLWWTEADALCVEVVDTGRWREPNPSGGIGRGIPLMQRLVDSVDLQTDEAGTRVRLRHALAA